jgi:hypothetical protein
MDPTASVHHIYFCANFGKSGTETLEMIIQAFGGRKHEPYTGVSLMLSSGQTEKARQVKSNHEHTHHFL